MTRTYTPHTVIVLPRLNASYTYILLTRLITAASHQQMLLTAKGTGLPTFIARPLEQLSTVLRALAAVLQLEPSGDSQATREADMAFDDAWGGLNQFLIACSRLRPGLNPDPAGTQALIDLLFPEGTSFLVKKYAAEWQESQTRIDALADPANVSYLDTLTVLGGTLHWTNVQEAHAELGTALGITTVLPTEPSAQVRTALDQALSALRVYVAKVMAWPDPEEVGSQELCDALLEPVVTWKDYQSSTTTASSTTGEKGSSATADSSTTTASSSADLSTAATSIGTA